MQSANHRLNSGFAGCFYDLVGFQGVLGVGGGYCDGKVSLGSSGCGLGFFVYFFDEYLCGLAYELVSEFFLEACVEIS